MDLFEELMMLAGVPLEEERLDEMKEKDVEAIEEKIETMQVTLNGIAGNALFTTTAQAISDLGADTDVNAVVMVFNGLPTALRTRDVIG